MNRPEMTDNNRRLSPYLTQFETWGFALGSSIGWGCFIMPGTTFLPDAGTAGTAIGMAIGALLMLLIAVNYHYMMNRTADVGGSYAYTRDAFGYDHGFLCAWFLFVTYVAVCWANVTALPLVARYVFGGALQKGYLYTAAGYSVYLGEALFSICAVLAAGALLITAKKTAARIEGILSFTFFAGTALCFVVALLNHPASTLAPAWAAGDPPISQVLRIVAVAPWAFVGFESISHASEEFAFSAKKSGKLLALAVIAGALCYILMVLQAVLQIPEGYAAWPEYIGSIGSLSGIRSVPTLSAAYESMGNAGVALLGAVMFSALFTSVIGCLIAAARLLYATAGDGIVPAALFRLDKNSVPRNALILIMILSLFVPFVGRTAVGWNVDISNIGAAIAFGYTSAAAYKAARQEGNTLMKAAGLFGVIISVVFAVLLLIPNYISGSILSAESYMILGGWCIFGFAAFRIILRWDKENRFGKTMVVWIALLALVFVASLMWGRQTTVRSSKAAADELNDYYVENYHIERSEENVIREEELTKHFLERIDMAYLRSSTVQAVMLLITLFIIFNVYSIMRMREKEIERERIAAEERSQAKSTFLSNMSHDMRTPMNAIIGYTEIASRSSVTEEERIEYLRKIGLSSKHLLALINDVLEMSRIESGRMELSEVSCNLRQMLDDLNVFMLQQAELKKQSFTVDASGIRDACVRADALRLNQVLINIAGNAVKYTPEGGTITVTAAEGHGAPEGYGDYEFRVKDNGMGMTKEFADRIFEAFEREHTSTISGIQGTGLGMAITKTIVDAMGGTIRVVTAPGEGSEFIVNLRFPLADDPEAEECGKESTVDLSGTRVLLVDDVVINREIAMMMLQEAGLLVDTAENGQEAVDKVAGSEHGRYDAVLMDIQMPVMNGYEATRAIRALEDPELHSIPIIAMTANAFEEDKKAAAAAGMDGHIAKPIDIGRILAALSECIHREKRADKTGE